MEEEKARMKKAEEERRARQQELKAQAELKAMEEEKARIIQAEERVGVSPWLAAKAEAEARRKKMLEEEEEFRARRKKVEEERRAIAQEIRAKAQAKAKAEDERRTQEQADEETRLKQAHEATRARKSRPKLQITPWGEIRAEEEAISNQAERGRRRRQPDLKAKADYTSMAEEEGSIHLKAESDNGQRYRFRPSDSWIKRTLAAETSEQIEEEELATVTSGDISKNGKKISWTSDPVATSSDRRVEIYVKDSDEVHIYDLHERVICSGRRRSGYFAKEVIKESKGLKKDVGRTRIRLSKSQAEVFPLVLDYLYYSKEADDMLSVDRACDLYILSGHLEIPKIQTSIADFYYHYICFENMRRFLNCASNHGAHYLVNVSRSKIAQLLMEYPESATLIRPKLLISITNVMNKYRWRPYHGNRQLHRRDKQTPLDPGLRYSISRLWSKAVFICLDHNKHRLTEDKMRKLTTEKALPEIDSTVAMGLINLESRFNAGSTECSPLQQRCVKAMTDDFSEIQKRFPTPSAMVQALERLPFHVQVAIANSVPF